MNINLIRRLEQAETLTVLAMVDALVRAGCAEPVPSAVPLGRGLLVVTGARRYVNRAVGVTLDNLNAEDVGVIVRHYADAGLTAAVQLSSWAPAATVSALGAAGFVPTWSRSVFAADVRASVNLVSATPPKHTIEIVEVGGDPALAAAAADVMVSESLSAGADRTSSDEFMAADLDASGTTQLVALLDGEPVGCGSLTIVGTPTQQTGWLGATASVGSTSSRVLTRCGLSLAQEQWIVRQQ